MGNQKCKKKPHSRKWTAVINRRKKQRISCASLDDVEASVSGEIHTPDKNGQSVTLDENISQILHENPAPCNINESCNNSLDNIHSNISLDSVVTSTKYETSTTPILKEKSFELHRTSPKKPYHNFLTCAIDNTLENGSFTSESIPSFNRNQSTGHPLRTYSRLPSTIQQAARGIKQETVEKNVATTRSPLECDSPNIDGPKIDGRRIFYPPFYFAQLREKFGNHCASCPCRIDDLREMKYVDHAMLTELVIRCNACGYSNSIWTETDHAADRMSISDGFVYGTLCAGTSYSTLQKELAAMGIPSISHVTYKSHRDKLASKIHRASELEIKEEYLE